MSYSTRVHVLQHYYTCNGAQLLRAQPGRVPIYKYISAAPSSVKVFMNHLLSCAQVDLVLRACFYGSGSPLDFGAHSVYVQCACPLCQLWRGLILWPLDQVKNIDNVSAISTYMRFILGLFGATLLYLSCGPTFQRAQDCFCQNSLMFMCTLKISTCLKIILCLY